MKVGTQTLEELIPYDFSSEIKTFKHGAIHFASTSKLQKVFPATSLTKFLDTF